MVDMSEMSLKRLVSNAKTGAHRSFAVPVIDGTLEDEIPAGTIWADSASDKVYVKISESSTVDLSGGEGSGTTYSGNQIIPRTLPHDRIIANSITANELAPGSVGGSEWALNVSALSSVLINSPYNGGIPLTLNIPFEQTGNIFLAQDNGVQRFRVGQITSAVGEDLPDASFSVYTQEEDRVALRVRGPGDMVLFENDDELPLFSVNSGGDTFVGGDFTAEGTISSQGGLSVDGPLTVTSQVNITGGAQVGEDFHIGGAMSVGGVTTFTAAPLLPTSYAARVGSAAWLRALGGSPNRIIIEGVSDTTVGELQLGTGGPVLSGSFGFPDDLWVGENKVLTAGSGGILGSQLAFDTITGAATAGVGNIASQTIQAYNIKDGSIVRSKLSAGAVGTLQVEDGTLTDEKLIAIAATKLLSGIIDADEIYLGPNGAIYLGPIDFSGITGERVQIDAVGIRAYNASNDSLAEFLPGSFMLRSATSGSRLTLASSSGLTLFDVDGSVTAQLAANGVFSLNSEYSGSRTVMDSQEGVKFIAAPTRNLAYNPGFNGGSQHEVGFNTEAVDDQRHIFAGQYAVRVKATNLNPVTLSYVDVPFKNTVGTGTSPSRTRVNACPNPSLATVITGWSASLGAASGVRDTAIGFARDHVLKLTATSSGAATVLAPVVTGLASGQQWTLSAYVRVTVQQTAIPIIQWIDSSDVVLSEVAALPVSLRAGIVEPLYVTATAPANTAKVRLKLMLPAMVNTDILEVSNALYERASGPDEYADGYTVGYQWDGLAGNSSSSLIAVPIADSTNNLLSIFVWSDVPCWTQIEGRDSTAGVSRGMSVATQITPNQWTRVYVACTGVMDKVRLHAPTSDAARQVRLTSYLWYSGVQVEKDATVPTPLCAGSEPGCFWEAAPYTSASLRDTDVITAQLSPSLGVTVSGAIVGGSITASSFFAGLISASEIQGTLIKASTLIGNLISGEQIIAESLHADAFIARSITADKIAVATLTGTEIAGDTITGDKIQAGTLIANVSLQTGVAGRRILISGPNNEIRFFPQEGESRYATLTSFVPTGLPDDVSLEIRAIDSAETSYVSRLLIQPDIVNIGVFDKTPDILPHGGQSIYTQDFAYIGTIISGLTTCGVSFDALDSTIQFQGRFEFGFFSADQAIAVGEIVTAVTTSQNTQISYGYTMLTDMACWYAVTGPATVGGTTNWLTLCSRTAAGVGWSSGDSASRTVRYWLVRTN